MRPWSLLTILNFSAWRPTDNGILMSPPLSVAKTKMNYEGHNYPSIYSRYFSSKLTNANNQQDQLRKIRQSWHARRSNNRMMIKVKTEVLYL